MRKILFITTRNIVRTCGELRLIKNRAEALFNEYGIQTDFLIITSTNIKKIGEPLSYDAKIEIINYKIYNIIKLISVINNIIEISEQKFCMNDYSDIIVSGLFLPLSLKKIKDRWSNKIIFMDIHGVYEDIYNSVNKNAWLKRAVYYLVYCFTKRFEPKYYNYVDGFFIVSSYLKDYVKGLCEPEVLESKKFVTVPCALLGFPIQDSEYANNRTLARNKYGFNDDDIVMIYSGGNAPWQRFDKSFAFFTENKKVNSAVRLLVLSQDIEEIKQTYGVIEGVVYDSIKPSEVYQTLCAGDYGLLIRDYSKTNTYAYPNKFLEYVNGRLVVIANDSILEVKQHIEEYHVGIIIGDNKKYIPDICDINSMKNNYAGLELLQDTSFVTTLKEFVDIT